MTTRPLCHGFFRMSKFMRLDGSESRPVPRYNEDVMSEAQAADKAPRQFVNYAFYKVDSAWRRLPEEERRRGKEEFARVVEDYRGRAVVIPFSTVGIRGDCDLLLWRIAFD